MPIIRSTNQNSQTLEEFYLEMISSKANYSVDKIGKTMLEFISMVNETFTETTLYGTTSHDTLVIQENDHWEDGWFVAVYSNGDSKVQFEYKMAEEDSPWKNAIVKGQANTIEEAKEFLIISMKESGGWSENKELHKLYRKLKGRHSESPKFTLWLEFEEVDPNNWDIENEFCNIHVDLEDGRHYGLTVWTYQFLQTAINDDKKTGENISGLYQKPPDLFVKELSRECIRQAIEDMLYIDDLEKVLNPSIFDKRKQK